MWIPTQYLFSDSATYTLTFAFTIMLNILAMWFIVGTISVILWFLSIKIGASKDSAPTKNTNPISEADEIFLQSKYQVSENTERKNSNDFFTTANDFKNKPLRYLSSIFSWFAWILFASVPTCYSAFNLIPFWSGIIISLLILFVRFCISLYTNVPLVIKRKRTGIALYRKVVSTMIQLHKKKVIFGFVAVLAVGVMINMGTYKSCVNDHVYSSYGIIYDQYEGNQLIFSSAFTRFLTIDKVCPPGPPCHVYATLPFDTATSVFLNVHTHVDVTNITLNYDTQLNYNTSGGKLGLQTFSSYVISPSEYDYRGERNVHTILLTGLQPDEMYTFELYYDGATQFTTTYQTLPAADSTSSYTLIYGGDIGVSDAATTVTKLIPGQNPRAMMIGGDLAYDNGEAYCYYSMDLTLWNLEQNIFTPLNRLVPFTVSVGNHDVGFDSLATVNVPITESGPSYYTLFPQHYPQSEAGNSAPGIPTVTERQTYHAHMIGNILNVILDPGYMTPYNGEQLAWLEQISQNYSTTAKIGIYHDPILSPCLSSYEAQGISDGLTYWIPIFDNYNYMSVFEHHTHTFKRSFPMRGLVPTENGTIYFGDGDWGVNPTPCKFDNSTGLYATYGSYNHIWVINVDQGNSAITYVPIAANGSAIDVVTNQTISNYLEPSVLEYNDL